MESVKRKILSATLTLVALLGMAALVQSHASAMQPNTGATQSALVKSRCADIKASLNRLEANDKLLRHNIGSTFLTVTNKLMTPLNQRIATSQLDGSKMLGVTARYTKAYKGRPEGDFYTAYLDYENSLLAAIAVDCTKQPTVFIDALDKARQNRLKLREATERLMELSRDYKDAFDTFKKQQQQGEER